MLYLGAHLDRTSSPAAAYERLLCRGWIQAWYAADSTYSGLLTDVERAWNRFAADDAGGEGPGRHLRAEFLCALIHASITSVAQRVSPTLLGRLVEEEIHTPEQAAAYAQRIVEPATRSDALTEIASAVDPRRRRGAFREALKAIAAVPEPYDRGKRLLAWIEGAPEDVLTDALPLLDEVATHPILAVLGDRIPVADLPALLEVAAALRDPHTDALRPFLASVAARIDPPALGALVSLAARRRNMGT